MRLSYSIVRHDSRSPESTRVDSRSSDVPPDDRRSFQQPNECQGQLADMARVWGYLEDSSRKSDRLGGRCRRHRADILNGLFFGDTAGQVRTAVRMSLVVCGIVACPNAIPRFSLARSPWYRLPCHGNEYAFDSIVATLGCGRLPLGARAARRTGSADAAHVKGRLDGFRLLRNPVWAEAKDSSNHGFSFREPVPTVRAEFRRPFPHIPKELCVALIAATPQAAPKPILVRVGGGRTTPVTIVVPPARA